MKTPSYRLGIDVGGTFTDAVLVDELGDQRIYKVPSTPSNPGLAFIEAVDLARRDEDINDGYLDRLVHGTTVVTNALIEGKTARVGLLVTEGFRDILEIARQIRPDLFDLRRQKPPPLIPRDLVVEVKERLGPKGEVLVPLDTDSVKKGASYLQRQGVVGVVVCFLHSYVDGRHELKSCEIIRRVMPGVDVTASSEIWPEFREYFRANTCIVNQIARPVVRDYLDTVQSELEARDLDKDFFIMQSNGESMSADLARELPVHLTESGPAAGLIAAAETGRRMNWSNVISFDMGGTTAKAGMIVDGQPALSQDYEVGTLALASGQRAKASGYPIRTPVLDIVEIGAGGGSLAWVDSGGALRVGPASAGAVPGPACYSRGGSQPTVTDANLVLGRIDRERFLGGSMELDIAAAREAIERECARKLGIAVEEAALGIVTIANAIMVRALRLVTIERGYDPRDFILVAFGGAGPLHACALASELGFERVVVPPHAGVFSARGLLLSRVGSLSATTKVVGLGTVEPAFIRSQFEKIAGQARDGVSKQGRPGKNAKLRYILDMRFKGQSYELPIEVADVNDEKVVDTLRAAFLVAHERAYGHASNSDEIELVNWKAFASSPESENQGLALAGGGRSKQIEPGPAALGQQLTGSCSYKRETLTTGSLVHGPCVITELDSTIFVADDFVATIDHAGNLIMERSDADPVLPSFVEPLTR